MPENLCPATMPGEGAAQIRLSGLTIMRFEEATGWKTLPSTRDGSRETWTLASAGAVKYRAACEYGDEIIGVAIDPAFLHCGIERTPDPEITTIAWCAR